VPAWHVRQRAFCEPASAGAKREEEGAEHLCDQVLIHAAHGFARRDALSHMERVWRAGRSMVVQDACCPMLVRDWRVRAEAQPNQELCTMTKSPSIGGHGGITPLSDHSAPSSTAPGQGASVDTGAQAGPQGGAALHGLNALSSGGAKTGGGARASFSAKPSATQGASTGSGPAGPGSRPGMSGRLGNMLHNASARLNSAGGGRLGSLLQDASGLSGGVANLAQAGAGLASAGMSVLGSIMQVEEAEASEIAKIAEQGAQNVENAAKG
jgi:hypothetical protein